MTKLVAASTTIEIAPCKRETPTSDWINTKVTLEYHIQQQSIKFQFPSEGVSLQVADYSRLVKGVRDYLQLLPVRPITSANRQLVDFHFMPIEPSFELSIGSGAYLDDRRQDGRVYVDFMIALKTLGIQELIGDQIGCTVEIRIQELLNFLSTLEQEVHDLMVA